MKLKLKRLENNDLPAPRRETPNAAAIDFSVCLTRPWYWIEAKPEGASITQKPSKLLGQGTEILLEPGDKVMVGVGFATEFENAVLHLVARSSLALSGVELPNAYGVIDADYRGELMAVLVNNGKASVRINHGDRIVQGELLPQPSFTIEEVDELSETARGEGGFGSTNR